MAAQSSALLAVGRVARAHGVRGRILVAPYYEGSLGLERASALWLSLGKGPLRRVEVARAERVNLGYLVALRGIEGREAAEALRGAEVQVERGELPSLEAGEFYAADLVGMALLDQRGGRRGVVTGLLAAGPQELLEVRTEAGAEALVPLALVQEIRDAAREVVAMVPEGLFEAQLGPPGPRE